jgi:tetratricopeptide (TPR) repeat protein
MNKFLWPYLLLSLVLFDLLGVSTRAIRAADYNSNRLFLAQASSQSIPKLLDQASQKALQQDYTSSVALLTQALNLSPSRDLTSQILLDRAKIYMMLAQPRLALGDLNSIAYSPSQASELASLWLLRGSAYILIKDYANALTALNAAQKLDSNNPMILSNRAVAYRAMGNLDLAKQDIQAAIKLQPNQINYYTLAVLLYQSKDYRGCFSLVSDLLKQSTPYAALFYQRGLCSSSLGNNDLAVADMLKVLVIDQGHADALEQLGVLMLRQGKLDAATQYLSRSSSIRLSSGDIDGYNRVLLLMKKVVRN